MPKVWNNATCDFIEVEEPPKVKRHCGCDHKQYFSEGFAMAELYAQFVGTRECRKHRDNHGN
jgi:hypothetical protein